MAKVLKDDVEDLALFLKYVQEQSMCLRQLLQMITDNTNMVMLTGNEVREKPTFVGDDHKVQMASQKLINFVRSDTKLATISLVKWSSIRLSYVLGSLNIAMHLFAVMSLVFKENLRVKHIIEPLEQIAHEIRNKLSANSNHMEKAGHIEENFVAYGNRLYMSLLDTIASMKEQEPNIVPAIPRSVDNGFFKILNMLDMEIGSTIIELNLVNSFNETDLRIFLLDGQEDTGQDILVDFDQRASEILYDIEHSNEDFDHRVQIYKHALEKTKDKMEKHLNDMMMEAAIAAGDPDNVDVAAKPCDMNRDIIEGKIKILQEEMVKMKKKSKRSKVNEKLIKKLTADLAKLDKFKDTNIGRLGLRFSNDKLWEMVKYENTTMIGKKNQHMALLTEVTQFEIDHAEKVTPTILDTVSKLVKSRFVTNNSLLHDKSVKYLPETSPFFYGKIMFWYVFLSVFLDNMIQRNIIDGQGQLLLRLLMATCTRYGNAPTWSRYDIIDGDTNDVVVIKKNNGQVSKMNDSFKKFLVIPKLLPVVANVMNRLQNTKAIVNFIKTTDPALTDEQIFTTLLIVAILKGHYDMPNTKFTKKMYSELIRLNNPTSKQPTMIKDMKEIPKLFEALEKVSKETELITEAIHFAKVADIEKILNLKNEINPDVRAFIKEMEDTLSSENIKVELQKAMKNLETDDIEQIFEMTKILSEGNKRKEFLLFSLGVIYLGRFGIVPLVKDDFSAFIRIHDPNDKASFLVNMKYAPYLHKINQDINNVEEDSKAMKVLRYVNHIIAPETKGYPPTLLNVPKILKPKT